MNTLTSVARGNCSRTQNVQPKGFFFCVVFFMTLSKSTKRVTCNFCIHSTLQCRTSTSGLHPLSQLARSVITFTAFESATNKIKLHIDFKFRLYSYIFFDEEKQTKSTLPATFHFAVKAKCCRRVNIMEKWPDCKNHFCIRTARPSRKYDLTERRPPVSRGTQLILQSHLLTHHKIIQTKKRPPAGRGTRLIFRGQNF